MSEDQTPPEEGVSGQVAPGSKVLLAPPTDDEVAAILAAVDAAWPRPAGAPAAGTPTPRWRFSGRWWTAPIPMRRSRPW